MKTRTKYTPYSDEFVVRAVAMIEACGSVSEVSRELGVARSALYRWQQKALESSNPTKESSGSKEAGASQAAELRLLRKELARLTMENDILKRLPRYSAHLPPRFQGIDRRGGSPDGCEPSSNLLCPTASTQHLLSARCHGSRPANQASHRRDLPSQPSLLWLPPHRLRTGQAGSLPWATENSPNHAPTRTSGSPTQTVHAENQ